MLKAGRTSVGLGTALLALALMIWVGTKPTATAAPPSIIPKDEHFDCSQIERFGLDKQTNVRAAQIVAGCRGENRPDASSQPAAPSLPSNPLARFKPLS